jgi:hypothetical protein
MAMRLKPRRLALLMVSLVSVSCGLIGDPAHLAVSCSVETQRGLNGVNYGKSNNSKMSMITSGSHKKGPRRLSLFRFGSRMTRGAIGAGF